MKRSSFIQLSAFAAAAICFPLLPSCNPTGGNPALSQADFLSRLFDTDTIREAGRAYLKKTPVENDKNKLVQLLADDKPVANSTDKQAILQYLNGKVQQDFEAGNVVLVEGWVLALTEARQCALFSLINPESKEK